MGLFDKYADEFMKKKAEMAEQDFKVLDEGKYIAKLEEVKCDLTGELAKYTCVYKVLKSESGDKEFAGENLFKNYAMSEKGTVWFMKDLEQMGIELEDIKSEEHLAEKMNKLQGKDALLYIKPREYNGKTYNNIYLNEFDYINEAPQTDQDEDILF